MSVSAVFPRCGRSWVRPLFRTGRVYGQVLLCNRVDFCFSCVLLLFHASIDLPVIRFAQKKSCLFAVPASLATTTSPAPMRLRYLITSLPHNSSLLDGRVRRKRSPLQASGGRSTLQSRASGLPSTAQGNSIRTEKEPPPTRLRNEYHRLP